MTNEIKQKIEQIKKGEVPEGYCYSRAGFSPNDWEKGILADVLYNEQRSVEKPKEPYWRVGIRSHAKGTFHEYVENPETVDMNELYVVRENDLIISVTFAWEHAVALADKNDDGLLVSHRFPTYVFKEGQNPVFYKSVVIQKRFKELLALISPGGAGRNRVMSKKDFLHLPCNIPPFTEQTKIAEILMQCDKVIELKQKLIDETKKLKKVFLSKMFPQKGENTPEIRFKGFTDAWEQRRLGEVAVKISEKNSNLLIKETFTNSAEFGIISQRDFFDHDISNSDNISSYFVVDNDDFVYNPRISTTAPCGPINRNKLGRKGIMSPLYTVFKTYDIDALYLEWYFKSNYWHAFMRYNGDTGARSDRFSIRNELFFQMPIPFPKIQEQKQIGMTFESLDTLITLHQRELQEWQNKKRALMQLLLTGIVRVTSCQKTN